jgi:hypothetical protein
LSYSDIAQAQSGCQNLCLGIVDKLPREVRDIIYEYVVTPDTVYVGTQYLTNVGDPCENDLGARFWNENYVGTQMTAELAQTWYRVSLFYFWEREKNDYIIDRFMAQDRWGISIKPYEHITRVRFDVGDTRLLNRTHWRGPDPLFQELVGSFTAPLRKLQEYHLPSYVKFTIRVHTYGSLSTKYLSGHSLAIAVQQLLDELHRVKANGHRFTVQWSEVYNLEFDSRDDDMLAATWCSKLEEVSRIAPCFVKSELIASSRRL